MSNIAVSTSNLFMPQKHAAAPQKTNPAQYKPHKEFSKADDISQTEKPKQSTEINTDVDQEDQVQTGGKKDRQRFDEVLEKKIDNKNSKSETENDKNLPTDVEKAKPLSVNIPIYEAENPEKAKKIISSQTVPIAVKELTANPETNNSINSMNEDAKIEPVKPILNLNPAKQIENETENKQSTNMQITPVPVKKFNESSASITSAIDNPLKNAKPQINPDNAVAKTDSKTYIIAETPNEKLINLQTDKTLKNENLNLTDNLTGTENTKVPKNIDLKSENAFQANENKFDKSAPSLESQIGLKTNITTPETKPETDLNTNITQKLSPDTEKNLHKSLSGKSGENKSSEMVNQISADSDTKTVNTGSTKMDIKTHQSTGSIINQVTEQIRSSSTANREQISIALDPPELGRVLIKFQQRNGEIIGIVEADKSRTHQEIADEMPMIVKSLNGNGIAVKRVEVVLTEQQTDETLDENSANENNNTGRQSLDSDSDNSKNKDSQSAPENFSRQYNPSQNAENYDNKVSDDAINMYA